MRNRLFPLLLAAAICGGPGLARAESEAPPISRDGLTEWQVTKCERYRKAWADATARRGMKGLGTQFLERHAAFIASGCIARADVCPRSKEELDIANVLVILGMNGGMASTFFPFACR